MEMYNTASINSYDIITQITMIIVRYMIRQPKKINIGHIIIMHINFRLLILQYCATLHRDQSTQTETKINVLMYIILTQFAHNTATHSKNL